MNLSDKQRLFAQDVAKLITYIFEKGYSCTLGEVYRTAEQAAWYADKGSGIKDSLHCKRLAVDINLFSPKGEYLTRSEEHTPFGEYWESLSDKNRWGGRFNDGNHYERQE